MSAIEKRINTVKSPWIILEHSKQVQREADAERERSTIWYLPNADAEAGGVYELLI